MASSQLPNPCEFDNFDSPVAEKFPMYLPVRTSKKASCVGSVLRNHKFRIVAGITCFLAMIGGTIGGAVFLSRTMQHINQGEVALSAASSSANITTTPTPLKSTVTRTKMVTQTSVVTSWITIPLTQVQSTVYAIVTAPNAPAVTSAPEDIDVGLERGSLSTQLLEV